MVTKILILGMTRVSTSLGLCLQKSGEMVVRSGFDPEIAATKTAYQMGAIDQIADSLSDGVQWADVILYALSPGKMFEIVKSIRSNIQSGCITVDINPIGQDTFSRMTELLPDPKAFIAWVPAINPKYLSDMDFSPVNAQEDLFQNSHIYIAGDINTHPEAIKLGNDLAILVGAKPLNIEPLELAGILALSHDFTSLIAAVAIQLVTSEPGWNEARKIAGFEFDHLSGILAAIQTRSIPEAQISDNRSNIQRMLEIYIQALQQIHSSLEEGEWSEITNVVNNAILAGQIWHKQRTTMSWSENQEMNPLLTQNLPKRLFNKRGKPS
ncbi:MAG: prephenate dehydrogenase/arogenate dehydrogenase family protein [Anaerolineaceae bacterium]|nr:prephenate dehydrogenase/arogenate dehydrogenase family protein [Anaerolineaceae bacterium]MBN2676964.1 prephenate dehydrogenase/arogenate dehydrogenase family protein [Anaerolineaceae bacterium]